MRRLLAGRYELLEQVGGSSWRAADTELEREVLVKLPAGEVGVTTLAHPNIVQVFDQGEEEGERYAVFEYLPGGSLERRLEAGSLPEAEARLAAAGVSAAMAYAHEHGVTHGSLRPANVLLDAEGNAKVAGFGRSGTPEDDEEALGALLQLLGVDAAGDAEAEVTAVLSPRPAQASRRPVALAALAALALLGAGIGAAFLATSDGSSSDRATTSISVQVPTGSTQAETQESVVTPPATTAETTTKGTTTVTPTQATTTVAPPATTEPAPTIEAPPTTEPPATTEPPPTTEPPATTEPPPTTAPATTAAQTETG